MGSGEDHLAGASPEQVKRVYDVLTGRVRVCPECGGRLTYLEDVDVAYCTDASCLWNQDEATRRINEKYAYEPDPADVAEDERDAQSQWDDAEVEPLGLYHPKTRDKRRERRSSDDGG